MNIVSISGQLERVASEIMIGRGEITRIALKNFPPTAPRVDAAGQPVSFAVIFPSKKVERKFDELVKELRA